ncbi:MAG TPA: hypothetical protein VHD83_07980 [Puia sp.]|nr:hypothetical protein [Puia sp.]
MTHTTNLRTLILNVAKKAAVTMVLLMTLGSSFAFTGTDNGNNDVNINSEIRTSFKKDFRNAQLLSTEGHKTFTKLTFKMDGLILSAFYSEGGELLATTRNIVSTQLPINLMMSLKNDYKSYWITELFEFTGDNDSCYYVSLESADGKVTLRSNGDQWEVYTSVKK